MAIPQLTYVKCMLKAKRLKAWIDMFSASQILFDFRKVWIWKFNKLGNVKEEEEQEEERGGGIW